VSQTKFIAYGEQGFWAYDVAHNIFLKCLIDAAEASSESNADWLSTAISSWRTACIPDIGLRLNANWTTSQKQMFVELAGEACAKLAARESIPAEESSRGQYLTICASTLEAQRLFSQQSSSNSAMQSLH
jgi:hypothetical protein